MGKRPDISEIFRWHSSNHAKGNLDDKLTLFVKLLARAAARADFERATRDARLKEDAPSYEKDLTHD